MHRSAMTHEHIGVRLTAALILLMAARMLLRFFVLGPDLSTLFGLGVAVVALVCMAAIAAGKRFPGR